MTPEYFARVPLSEALCFARGVQRRYREAWRQTRFATYIIAAPSYKNLDYDKMLVLPWEDDDSKEPRLTEEQEREAVARLRALAAQFSKIKEK